VSYRLVVKPSAEKDVGRLPKQMRLRILDRMAQIAADPRLPGSSKLAGSSDAYRIHVGDWRIVYEIDDKNLVVFATIVGQRREVYRGI